MCFPCTRNTQGAQSPPPFDPVKMAVQEELQQQQRQEESARCEFEGRIKMGHELLQKANYADAIAWFKSANDFFKQDEQLIVDFDETEADKGLKMAGDQLFRMGRYQEALSAYLSANDADSEVQQTLEKLAQARNSK